MLRVPGEGARAPGSARAPERAAQCLAGVGVRLLRADKRRFGRLRVEQSNAVLLQIIIQILLYFCVAFSRVVYANGAEIFQLQKRID